MNTKQYIFSLENIFITFSSVIVFIVSIAIFSAELNIFNIINLTSFLICLAVIWIFLGYLFFRHKVNILIDYKDITAFLIVLLICSLNVFFFHESFAGGRDDGVYANTALYLSNYNSLHIKELNVATFPGFINTSKGIITQFYIGYPAWIATIIKIFGTNGIKYANFPLLTIGFISIYFICKKISSWKTGIITILLVASTYPFLWFTRKTFSENLTFMLTWYGVYCLIKGYEERSMKYLLISLIAMAIQLTIRVESIPMVIIALITILVAYFKYNVRSSLLFISVVVIVSLIPAGFYYLSLDPRYSEILYSQFSHLITILSGNTIKHNPLAVGPQIDKSIIEYHQSELVFTLLQLYNLYFFILTIPMLILMSFLFSIKRKRVFLWLVIIFILPNLYFLYKPMITFDQPWFLRRFMPVIIPTSIMCFSFVISFFGRRIQALLVCLIIINSILISLPIITFREYQGVTDQIKNNFKNTLSKDDLLLVDYENTGHYKLAEPLFFLRGYNSVAVQDYSIKKLFKQKISNDKSLYEGQTFTINPKSICRYKNLYILTTQYEPNILTNVVSDDKTKKIKDFKLTYDELIKTCELFRITDKATFEDMAHVNFNAAKEYCSITPNTIYSQHVNLRLEEINQDVFDHLKQENCS